MVNGSLNGQVFVEGGVLKGTGTINSNLTIASGIHIPGASPGIMQVKGNYTLASDATIQSKFMALLRALNMIRSISMAAAEP